ncbi:MAG: hypothetical protein JWN82_571 [Candidatus Saccharibacteria bacterium]|nr:hypothetical protein [Candidatus Saccharibacteria bacterium]
MPNQSPELQTVIDELRTNLEKDKFVGSLVTFGELVANPQVGGDGFRIVRRDAIDQNPKHVRAQDRFVSEAGVELFDRGGNYLEAKAGFVIYRDAVEHRGIVGKRLSAYVTAAEVFVGPAVSDGVEDTDAYIALRVTTNPPAVYYRAGEDDVLHEIAPKTPEWRDADHLAQQVIHGY